MCTTKIFALKYQICSGLLRWWKVHPLHCQSNNRQWQIFHCSNWNLAVRQRLFHGIKLPRFHFWSVLFIIFSTNWTGYGRPIPASVEIIFTESETALADVSRVHSDCRMLDFRVFSEKLHNKYFLFVTEHKLFPTIWNRQEQWKINVVAIFVLQLKSAPQCVAPLTERWADKKLCSAILSDPISYEHVNDTKYVRSPQMDIWCQQAKKGYIDPSDVQLPTST